MTITAPEYNAVHEAGHAVAWHALVRPLGYRMSAATIIPDGAGSGGHVVAAGCWDVSGFVEAEPDKWRLRTDDECAALVRRLETSRRFRRAMAIMSYAGMAATFWFYSTTAGGEYDEVEAEPLLQALNKDRPWLIGEANRFVAQHAQKIERVALALTERRTLSADEIGRIVRQSRKYEILRLNAAEPGIEK